MCEMEAIGRAGCRATERTCCKPFHSAGKATPAPLQLSSQSGTGATGGNLWKDRSPQAQAWSDYVFILCVRSHVYTLMWLLMPPRM